MVGGDWNCNLTYLACESIFCATISGLSNSLFVRAEAGIEIELI